MERLIHKIADEIATAGGSAYYVGGYVRDRIRGLASEDFDIEVYGLDLASLEEILRHHGRCEAVGRAFGVLKFSTTRGDADFSLPRRESKSGSGHRGFLVDLDPSITPEEACARRDFSINAMLMSIPAGEILDFHGGREDLEAGRLRHTSPAFVEDPLRAYRLMQFAARFEMTADPGTLTLCGEMELGDLAPERVFAEFEKLLLLAERPGHGLAVAREAGILDYHPELEALVDCPQDPTWHPEGTVWEHTLMVLDAAAALRNGDRRRDLALMFGALCHDFGKPLCTRRKQGRIVSPGHSELGIEPTRRFLGRMSRDRALLDEVERFVLYHLRPADFYRVREQIRDSSIRRLALQVNIQELVEVARADHLGRTTPEALASEFPAGEWLLAKAESLQVEREAPAPILMGRHLLERGWREGPEMGALLKQAYEAQLDGAFADIDGALRWLATHDPQSPLTPPEMAN